MTNSIGFRAGRAAALAAGLACALWSGSAAAADDRCRVTDPTGTPLNIRTAPQGKVISTIQNGVLVKVLDTAYDGKGNPWVRIGSHPQGKPIGWVYREFVSCF